MTGKTSNSNIGIARLETGVRNLDAVFHGGLPRGSVIAVGGAPGSGKTILSQQICFHNATPERRVLYFSTLSEPTAKTLRYLSQFSFFDPSKLETSVCFVDLGVIIRSKGLEPASELIMEQVKKVQPAIVVIDSFKVFNDLAASTEELRKFGYELTVKLMAWEVTALLLGEYGKADYEQNPIFSIIDGLVMMSQREASGEQQRFIQVVKMRGTKHVPDEQPFAITSAGIEVYAPRAIIKRATHVGDGSLARLRTGISNLDSLLGEGIPLGSSLLVSGVAGTGKTVLLLEFLYRGAKAGEKGVLFSFEETRERLCATARSIGWSLDAELERGMVDIIFIPQPDILVEKHMLMMSERIASMGAKRIAIDSVSVFLHKISEAQVSREKVFQLATMVHNVHGVGLFATDVPYGTSQISRFGVEETVVDGVILLTATQEGLRRQRYLEVYKLRNTGHSTGRHAMEIGPTGIRVFPRYGLDTAAEQAFTSGDSKQRLGSGVPGLDELLSGGLLRRSATLVSGSAGIGKTVLSTQFLLEGAKLGEPGLFVSAEEEASQLLERADALGLPLRAAVEAGRVAIVYLSQEHTQAAQFPSILTSALIERRAQRLVLDGVSHMIGDALNPGELSRLLRALVTRAKKLGVTSLLTLESSELFARDSVTHWGLSPVSDNLLMLRYVSTSDGLRPSLTIIKTRGTPHDPGTYEAPISQGGMSMGVSIVDPTSEPPAQPPASPRRRQRPKS